MSLMFALRSLMMGKSNHKFFDLSENKILRIYYTNRTVLFWMCAGNEAFYCALYLLYFTEGPICKNSNSLELRVRIWKICSYQLYFCFAVAGLSLFKVIAYISAPVAFVKSCISLLHGYSACINLSIIDTKEREALRKAK